MKVLAITFLILLGGTSCFRAQSINGVYADSSNGALKNCFAVFSQEGDTIRMTHYIEFNGLPFVEYGEGVVTGDSLIYRVKVTLNGPNWPTTGLHRLRIEENGMALRGTYLDAKGNTGALVFTKETFDE